MEYCDRRNGKTRCDLYAERDSFVSVQRQSRYHGILFFGGAARISASAACGMHSGEAAGTLQGHSHLSFLCRHREDTPLKKRYNE